MSRLPDGFAVELAPGVRRRRGGRTLIGGAPVRLLTLSPSAVAMLPIGDRLTVVDAGTAALARRLLDTGVAHPRPAPGVRDRAVTVVVPVRDRPAGLDRLLTAVRATTDRLPVVVVDDGSLDAAAVAAVCARHGARLLRREVSGGPAAARNQGLAAADTELVTLLDSDCVPLPGWLEALLGHFDDPTVAVAAPRIVALPGDRGRLAAYETACSSLDLGPRESLVAPRTAVPYVPSAALLVRRAVLGAGYDETMHVAEDVDLVWRLAAAGATVRYEPRARVAHEHRTRAGSWARRRAFYGTGAAPLADRHGRAVAPLVLSPWSALAWALVWTRRPLGWGGAAAVLGVATVRLARLIAGPGTVTVDDLALAGRIVAGGTLGAGRQLAVSLGRHHWPVTALVAVASPRSRRRLVAVGVGEAVLTWARTRPPVDVVTFVLGRRLDDVCYGAGLWTGAWRHRSTAALRPARR